MKHPILLFCCFLAILQAAAQSDYYPSHLTGLKGFSRCIEWGNSHIKGQANSTPAMEAIHYLNAEGLSSAGSSEDFGPDEGIEKADYNPDFSTLDPF